MAVINFIEKYTRIHRLNIHSHQYWEILYIIQGSGSFRFQDKTVLSYNAGDIVCVPPDMPHRNFPHKGFQNINLTIANWKPNNISEPTVISHVESNDFFQILNQAYKNFHKQNPPAELLLSLTDLIVQYIDYFCQCAKPSALSLELHNIIIEQFADPYFDLNEVYRQFPFTADYIRKKFIAEFGISPSQLLTRTRIDNAILLITKRSDFNYSMKEIAEKCGYLDPLYFSRVFKKVIGVTPSAFKLNSLKGNQAADVDSSENNDE